jgi:hypothetical protein
MPRLAFGGIAADAALAPLLQSASASMLTALALATPPALLVAYLMRSEGPRTGLPSRPRAASAGTR